MTDANVAILAPRLLPKIIAVLRRTPTTTTADRDAAVLASLAAKLLRSVRFADVLALATADDLVAALAADAAPPTNVLAMTVLHKAADEAADDVAPSPAALEQLAALPGLVAALVAAGWPPRPSRSARRAAASSATCSTSTVRCPCPPRPRRPGHSSTAPAPSSSKNPWAVAAAACASCAARPAPAGSGAASSTTPPSRAS